MYKTIFKAEGHLFLSPSPSPQPRDRTEMPGAFSQKGRTKTNCVGGHRKIPRPAPALMLHTLHPIVTKKFSKFWPSFSGMKASNPAAGPCV